MIDATPLFVTAAVVGTIHMSAPDHWATLAVLGKTGRWTSHRLLGFSLLTGIGHVTLSIILGFVVVGVSSLFSSLYSNYLTEAAAVIMVVAGFFVAFRAFRSKDNNQQNENRLSSGSAESLTKTAGYFAVLGAALSPDLSILPVFLVASPLGLFPAFYTILVFAVSSIITLLILVLAFSKGLAKALEKLPRKYNDAIAGLVIAAVGIYILILG
jgi:nickel/cobalt exporter